MTAAAGETRHPDGWVPSQITEVADAARVWLDNTDPDLSAQVFNATLAELVALVWPHAYRAGYAAGQAGLLPVSGVHCPRCGGDAKLTSYGLCGPCETAVRAEIAAEETRW